MNKYDPLWLDLNNLLSYLRSSNVVSLVNDYYFQYGNHAPGYLLKSQIDIVQKHLDDSDEYTDDSEVKDSIKRGVDQLNQGEGVPFSQIYKKS